MTLEEYIIKRKREDGINEFDLSKRLENTKICVNYVFEYFTHYLDTTPADEKTVLHDQKVEKYRNMLRAYEPDVQDWLVSMYSSHGKYMHKQLKNLITDTYFLLYDSDAEFRALSYEIYPQAVKRFKFLEGQSEMVYRFIKEVHRVQNLFQPFDSDFYISDSVNAWIYETYNVHGVNIYNFCYEWAHSFYENTALWPKGHKRKSPYYEKSLEYKGVSINDTLFWDYDYRQKNNLFALDSLYRAMPKKSFIKGRKQEFEATILYCWLHGVTSDDAYWKEYTEAVLD